MNDKLRLEIDAIAADARSGATALLTRAIAVLRAAAADRGTLDAVADQLCRAQPSMAGFRTAAAVARGAHDPASALDDLAARIARAPALIARHTVALLKLRRRTGAVRLVTCSRSHLVEQAIRALAAQNDVQVACAEGRPALEGRDLAGSLAAAGIAVTLYTDAGLAVAVRDAEALLVGADAVAPDAFINKVGTGPLAALAAVNGVPTYVLAGREKFVSAAVFADLRLGAGNGFEVWRSAPEGVALANPYFEVIHTSLVAGVVTDAGTIAPEQIVGLLLSGRSM